MRILQISPTHFSDESFIGGAERYVLELSRALARTDEVVLVSFAEEASSHSEGTLRIEHLRRHPLLRSRPLYHLPLSRAFREFLRWADVIHCHQAHNFVTDIALLGGQCYGKKVFVTDLGGGHRYALARHFPLLDRSRAFLLISEYSKRLWAESPSSTHPQRLEVIYGGVDTEKFCPAATPRKKSALFVGRLMPHKGVDVILDAIQGDLSLDIVGRAYHEDYFLLLKKKSEGKNVRFHTGVSDADLVKMYQQSLVALQTSIYEDCYGHRSVAPELLGLAALEAQACGTPVIVTNVASLPEVIQDQRTGFLVPPNNPIPIRERIELLAANPGRADEMGRAAREWVVQRFTWEAVAKRCLSAYADAN